MSSGNRGAFITPCPAKSGGGSTIVVDVSCQPNVYVDVSCQPNVYVDVSCQPIVNVASPFTATNFDAFSRLRVSNPYTLFEFTSILGKGNSGEGPDNIDEELSGSGTSTWMPQSYINMDVSGTGYVIRQSHEYILYQAGKSKLVMMTGVLYHDGTNTTTGLISRIGPFDASMGVFVEYSNDTTYVVIRSFGVDTRISQANWNLDHLDGTGPSGVTVRFDKAQIYVFDFEWLGVGRVRCGIVIGGTLYYYHEFGHVNELDYPYTRTAKLPLRYEIRGGPTTRNSMHMMCGTVISEGGFSPLTRSFWFPKAQATRFIDINLPPTGTFVPFVSLRLRSSYPHRYGTLKVKRIDVFNTNTSEYGAWQLVLGGSQTAAGPAANFVPYDVSSSIVEVNAAYTNASRWNGGKVLASDFYTTRVNSIQFTTTDEIIQAPAVCFNQFTNTSDVVTLLVNTFVGGQNKVYFNLQWIELT
jgi:hypothetical protein